MGDGWLQLLPRPDPRFARAQVDPLGVRATREAPGVQLRPRSSTALRVGAREGAAGAQVEARAGPSQSSLIEAPPHLEWEVVNLGQQRRPSCDVGFDGRQCSVPAGRRGGRRQTQDGLLPQVPGTVVRVATRGSAGRSGSAVGTVQKPLLGDHEPAFIPRPAPVHEAALGPEVAGFAHVHPANCGELAVASERVVDQGAACAQRVPGRPVLVGEKGGIPGPVCCIGRRGWRAATGEGHGQHDGADQEHGSSDWRSHPIAHGSGFRHVHGIRSGGDRSV